MKEEEYKVSGYKFADIYDYKEAKKDEETIIFIKRNTDLNDLNNVVKLYNKLVERKSLKTVVGYVFLKELQERITKSGMLSLDNVPGIYVEKNQKEVKTYSKTVELELEKKYTKINGDIKIKLRNSRIIIGFLGVIIICMILISVLSDRNIFSKYENKIIDKYSTWEEELTSREKSLEIRENTFKNIENKNIEN